LTGEAKEIGKCVVIFQPSGRRGYIPKGKTLKQASVVLGVDIEGVCGEKAVCGKCKVRVEQARFEKYGVKSGMESLSPIGASEKRFLTPKQIEQGFRLSCQAKVLDDVIVLVPEESRLGKQVVRKEARDIQIKLNPAVKKYYVEIPKATLEDNRADWERLQSELKNRHSLAQLSIDYQVLLTLQETVRQAGWKVTVSVWHGEEIIKVEPGRVEKAFGLAVDIGTTTVAGYLCDLTDGRLIATASMMNPQVIYGEDVMSRIGHTLTSPEGLDDLNRAIIDGLNHIAEEASSSARIKPADILDMTVVGNTCMHHLFLNIDPRQMGQSPFVPALHHSLDVKARDLGIKIPGEASKDTEKEEAEMTPIRSAGIKIAPGAYVHVLPIEAGFVGADNVGVLIAETPYEQDGMELIIDIGTNGELVLGNRKRLLSSSCATGPAFEGAEIKFGMRAAPGAIEKIVIDKGTLDVRFKVIGKETWNTETEKPDAKGICGSGIIDVVPQLYLAGIIDRTGRFNRNLKTPRYREIDNQPEFVIAWEKETSIGQDIVICQKDVRAIQLAKGAMYAGAKVMMKTLGVEKLDKIILAGAFGSYIDKVSAALLGLFPDCEIENITSVGNAAGDGARMALLDADKRKEADEIARKVEYIELTLEPEFNKIFAEAMWIPHMKDQFPHLAHLLPS
jgi:uncharacterized 2Fe-2S/4Fe-4S cluster protein (DUF4445 family)